MLRPVLSAARRRRAGSYARYRLPSRSPACRDYSHAVMAQEKSDPLRILFCGSDAFSCASLDALYRENIENRDLIESIDVVVRPGKPTGRGNKEIRHPPIRSQAEKLQLPLHERDTFTGWNMPDYINLIIAVSFGLFVPPRLLNAAKYGGLNLHPSMLPDLRGPAPLHHALLRSRPFTGVTLQTLDDKAFDHGIVLAQTPVDKPIRIPVDCNVEHLHHIVTPVAAEMLVQGLRDRLHIPPLKDRGWKSQAAHDHTADLFYHMGHQFKSDPEAHASKMTTRDKQLLIPAYSKAEVVAAMKGGENPNRFGENGRRKRYSTRTIVPNEQRLSHDDFCDIMVRQRVLGSLWLKARDSHGSVKRIIMGEVKLRGPSLADWQVRGVETKRPESRLRPNIIVQRLMAFREEDDGTLVEWPLQFLKVNDEDDDSIWLFDDMKQLPAEHQRDHPTRGRSAHEIFSLVRPGWEQIKVLVGHCLQIKMLKVEGSTKEPAWKALQHFEREFVHFRDIDRPHRPRWRQPPSPISPPKQKEW